MEHIYNIGDEECYHVTHSIVVNRSSTDERFVDIFIDGNILFEFCPNGDVWVAKEQDFKKLNLLRYIQ